ncbi:hypothetical protein Tco_0471811 [Tanacetum coccineum]
MVEAASKFQNLLKIGMLVWGKLHELGEVNPNHAYYNGSCTNLPLRYQFYQGRLLASFEDDENYEHVGQETRSQGGKDDQDKQGKDLKILELETSIANDTSCLVPQ